MATMTIDRAVRIARWCAAECDRQRSGELSVGWMYEGWQHAHRYCQRPPTLRDILALGAVVEPRRNRHGLRKVAVRVGFDAKMDHELVPGALDQLISHWGDAEADQWYYQYEEIHPFRDGNGRTGTLLWNWHRGTLDTPEVPPDFWAERDQAMRAAYWRRALRESLKGREGWES